MSHAPCSNCSQPRLAGYEHCVRCQCRIYADSQRVLEACQVGISGGLADTQINDILRESAEHHARTATQRPVCSHCHKPIAPGDEGEWRKSLHGSPCENELVAKAFRRSA